MSLKRAIDFVGVTVSTMGILIGVWILKIVLAGFPHSVEQILSDSARLFSIFLFPSFFCWLGYVTLLRKDPGDYQVIMLYAAIIIAVITFVNAIALTWLFLNPVVFIVYVPLVVTSIVAIFSLIRTTKPDIHQKSDSIYNQFLLLSGVLAIVVVICLVSFVLMRLFLGIYLLIPIIAYSTAIIFAILKQRSERTLNPAGFLFIWGGLGNIILGATISMTSGLYFSPIIVILLITGLTASLLRN